jgi:hypothetical protein
MGMTIYTSHDIFELSESGDERGGSRVLTFIVSCHEKEEAEELIMTGTPGYYYIIPCYNTLSVGEPNG